MCGGESVPWLSRTDKCVIFSTSEAEYVATTVVVVKEAVFFVWYFMFPQVGAPCIPVFEDNQGAVQLAQNPTTNSNFEHVDGRCHFYQGMND